MDLATSSKWVICRICLKNSSGEMIKILDNPDMDLVRKIEQCGGISLTIAPNLPDSICNKCLILLRAASKFREKIQRSQAELVEKFTRQEPLYDQTYTEQVKEEYKVEFLPENNNEIGETEHTTDTNTELIIPADDAVESNDESLLYSVEYEDMESEMIQVDAANEIVDAPFEVLRHNDKLIDYVDQDMDNLELVLDIEGEKDGSSFKIVPQFTTATVNRPKKSSRKRKADKTNCSEDNVAPNHICTYCGNSYAEKSKLSLHMKIHTKVKPHQCEICLKRFGQTPQLARHMNSHTGSRPFMCKYCSASFADPSTRIKHERIHTNERPYQCTVCGKAFSYSNVLKVHMMTHTGEKPYVCKYCGKQFNQTHHKNKHERLHEDSKLKFKKKDEDCQIII